MRGAQPRRRPVPALVLDAGTGLRQVTGLLGGRPFAGTILLTHLHWDHVHGLPFFRGGRPGRRPGHAAAARPRRRRESAAAVLARGMSPPHFPIGPAGLRGDWTFGMARPGQLKAEGFTVEAREIPHKGGRTFGYRVSDGHSVLDLPPRPLPHRPRPGTRGAGRVPPGRPGPGGRRRPAHPRRVPAGRRGGRGGVRSGTRRPSTRRAWDSGPGRGGWRWPTTSRTGPTTSWTGWPPRSRAARRRGGPDVMVAAEGGILEL